MKKLLTICLIMATLFTVNAQDKKPTKEQTLEYLKSVLLGVEGGTKNEDRDESCYRLYEMELNGCILKTRYEARDVYKGITYNWTKSNKVDEIDLSQVESFRLTVKSRNYYKSYNDNLSLLFSTKQNKDIGRNAYYCTPDNSEKALKALNHLRKLCGAPEPISFD